LSASYDGMDGKVKNFNPGAHRRHAGIACEACHREGGGPKHVNGRVTLKAEIDYSFGTAVAWPSPGGGTCGRGNGNPGCHTPSMGRCAWLPGDACRR